MRVLHITGNFIYMHTETLASFYVAFNAKEIISTMFYITIYNNFIIIIFYIVSERFAVERKIYLAFNYE